ncbi:hypothetical protein ON010_g9031 [Phytophthora cinnamomi]|nr:hypothetical protein ON010_g9031 [Phytophthora cinnamomi]
MTHSRHQEQCAARRRPKASCPPAPKDCQSDHRGSSGCDHDLFIQPTDDLVYAIDIQVINMLYANTDLVFTAAV